MRYLFILGRNPELSIAELKSYFKKTGNEILEFSRRGNSAMIELEKPIDAGAVEFLGGTIAIGIILCPIKNIDRMEIYYSEKNNFSYVLWDFSKKTDDVREYLKSRFRREKLKASEKKLREEMDLQDEDEKGQRLDSKVDEQYFVYDEFFGKIVQFSDYKKISDRDMKKPVRRESLSISPRLAKIMINLSEVKENEILLDAFCGIGVILQEALLQEIKVIGIDKDKNAISGCRENLKWFKFSEDNYKIINDDSSKIKLGETVNGMASEPDFGETMKKLPTKEQAGNMIKRYEKIIAGVLKNVKKYLSENTRIVFTAPLIRTEKNRTGCDFKKLSSETGLKVAEGFPISEFREGQIVGREIVVFEDN